MSPRDLDSYLVHSAWHSCSRYALQQVKYVCTGAFDLEGATGGDGRGFSGWGTCAATV